jgi:hypothetical protein
MKAAAVLTILVWLAALAVSLLAFEQTFWVIVLEGIFSLRMLLLFHRCLREGL